jgi:hypothetical protein
MNEKIIKLAKQIIKRAGWWAIDSPETGQIDWNQPEKQGFINAIPGSKDKLKLVNGDGPADVMDAALRKIKELYIMSWKREPAYDDYKAVFNFCTGAMRREEEQKQ